VLPEEQILSCTASNFPSLVSNYLPSTKAYLQKKFFSELIQQKLEENFKIALKSGLWVMICYKKQEYIYKSRKLN